MSEMSLQLYNFSLLKHNKKLSGISTIFKESVDLPLPRDLECNHVVGVQAQITQGSEFPELKFIPALSSIYGFRGWGGRPPLKS
jgi:hypothetical protein